MPIRALTSNQHRQVLERLVELGKSADVKHLHSAGPEYTSLMVSFLMHCIAAAESLLRLHDCFGRDYFPTTVGYVIVRPIFKIDVTAHYITLDPIPRSHQYIEFESILNKRQMEAWRKHRSSKKANWREAMEIAWQDGWALRGSNPWI